MGGKTTTSTQSVQIPPEVLARYNAVNARAEDVAARPFIPYSDDPNAFVAALTPSQQAGIENINAAAGMSQPSFAAGQNMILGGLSTGAPLVQQGLGQGQALTGNALDVGSRFGANAEAAIGAGMGPVNAEQFSGAQIDKYMSPYIKNVVDAQQALQQQEAEQQRSAMNTQAIMSGAFGGDRGGIAQANLARQQSLANQATLANILQGGYGQALGAFQQQQGVNLAAGQANRAAMQNAANQLAALGQQQYAQSLGAGQNLYNMGLGAGQALYGMGTGAGQAYAGLGAQAEQAALNAAQAQMAAGQIQQQTDQAGKTALYNQFLQQQGYPYQQAQFLANIAMGTGALSGSTTTTTQPSGWSDRRLKENIRKVGKTYDGQDIYAYNLKGEKRTQLGLMAQDVEKHTPEAVGLSRGYKTLDYKKATDDAAKRGHFADGGLVPSSMGGAVYEPGAFARGGYADGGYAASDWQKLPNGNYLAPDSSVLTPSQFQEQYGNAAAGTSSGSASTTQAPDIASMYRQNLGRAGTADEYAYWSGLMSSRGLTADQIRQEIANSEEGKAWAAKSANQMPTGIPNKPYQEALTYKPEAFSQRAPITRNASGFAAAAPGSSYSAFAAPITMGTGAMSGSTPTATGKGPSTGYTPTATGKGPAPAPATPAAPPPPSRYGSAYQPPAPMPTATGKGSTPGYPSTGYSAPTATGKGPVASMATGGRIHKNIGGSLLQLAAEHARNYEKMAGPPNPEALARVKHSIQQPSAEAIRRLSPGSLPQKPQSGVKTAADMGTQLANLYKTGKEIRKDVSDFFKKEPAPATGQQGTSGGTTTTTTTPGGSAPAAAPAARQQSASIDQPSIYDSTRGATDRAFSMSDAGSGSGLAPAGSDASSMLSSLGPEESLDALGGLGGGGDFLSAFAARGGRINRDAGGRIGYRAGGLPSGLAQGEGIDIPDEVAGYKLNEGLPRPSGGGGGGGSNPLGTALTVASVATKVLPFLASLSDSRVKHHKEPIGELFDGQKVYRYDFGDGRTEIGLMAQEVEKHRPEAVRTVDGLKMVDYDKAIERVHKYGGGGLAGVPVLEEERRATDEADLNDRRIRLAALQRAETMSDAEPTGLVGGARMASASPAAPPPAAPSAAAAPVAEPPAETAPAPAPVAKSPIVERATEVTRNMPMGPWERIGEELKAPSLLRDERVIVPLIAGFGALLASDKPRFSQALGEGLAGAAGAYGAVRGQTQEIAESEARERLGLMRAGKESIIFDSQNRPVYVLVFDPKTKRLAPMDFNEAYRRRDELDLLPTTRQEMERIVRENPDAVKSSAPAAGAAGAGAAGAGATPAGRPAGAGAGAATTTSTEPGAGRVSADQPEAVPAEQRRAGAGAPVPVMKIFSPTDKDVARINTATEQLRGQDTRGIPDYYTEATNRSKDAGTQRTLMFQFANAYAGLPEKGPMSPGAVAPVIRNIGEVGQSFLKSLGIKGPLNQADIDRAVAIDKITAQMKAQASEATGQRSYSAFQALGGLAPTIGTPSGGGAKNLASIIVENQKQIDEDLFAKQLLDSAENKTYARSTGQIVGELFRDRFGPKYEAERDALAKMFMEPYTVRGRPVKDPETGRTINWMQWLSDPTNAKSLTPREQAQIESRFGEGILRYFPGVRR